MQPPQSIPPLTEEGVKKLVGLNCCYKIKQPRRPHERGHWWGEIAEVRFITPNSAAVWIVPNTARAGHAKWHDLKTIRFKNHEDDPLKIAIHRAQMDAREKGITSS